MDKAFGTKPGYVLRIGYESKTNKRKSSATTIDLEKCVNNTQDEFQNLRMIQTQMEAMKVGFIVVGSKYSHLNFQVYNNMLLIKANQKNSLFTFNNNQLNNFFTYLIWFLIE